MILILGAMDEEIGELRARLTEVSEASSAGVAIARGQLAGKEVCVAKSGVGKVMAAMVTQRLVGSFAPTAVIVTGLAGGLAPHLQIGDIVIGRDCVQHDLCAMSLGFERGQIPFTDLRFIPGDERLRARALSFKSDGIRVIEGRILTGDQFIKHAELSSHRYLTEELHGDAVEMEGAAIATVCAINSVPFLIVRTISDRANEHALIDFLKFLPVASKHSVDLIEWVVRGS